MWLAIQSRLARRHCPGGVGGVQLGTLLTERGGSLLRPCQLGPGLRRGGGKGAGTGGVWSPGLGPELGPGLGEVTIGASGGAGLDVPLSFRPFWFPRGGGGPGATSVVLLDSWTPAFAGERDGAFVLFQNDSTTPPSLSTPAEAGVQLGDVAGRGQRVVTATLPTGPRPSPGWRRVGRPGRAEARMDDRTTGRPDVRDNGSARTEVVQMG